MGAKGKYQEWIEPNGLLQIEGWAREGLSEEQISHNIGINERTFTEWKTKFPSIMSALKKGKAPADLEVENALFKKATGFTQKITKPIKVKTRKQLKDKGFIEEEHIEYVEEEIYIPPDTVAQIFWLKNRRPSRWRDKIEVPPETGNELLQSLLDLERKTKHD